MLFAPGAVAGSNLSQPDNITRAAQLNRQIISPFCPGQTLDSCTSPAAATWRAEIRQWVSDGVASEEIRARLAARAKRDLSVVPPQNTISHMLWLLSLAGVLMALWITRYIRKGPPPDRQTTGETDPLIVSKADERLHARLEQRIDDELAMLD